MSINKKMNSNILKIFLIASFFSINGNLYSGTSSDLDNKNSNFDNEILNKDNNFNYANEYLLGAGDVLLILFTGAPELSGQYGIGPDGMIYLPELEGINANFLTLSEFKTKITEQYKEVLIAPNINIQLAKVRPVRVYIKGEVKTPGFYKLNLDNENYTLNTRESQNLESNNQSTTMIQNNLLFPTLYDGLKRAKGVTSYSDLSRITVIRNNSNQKGGGKIKTELDFLSLFLEGDQSQNIRLFDGDTIIVPKSKNTLKEQLLEVNKSNMNPEFVNVFVSGKVTTGGFITIPKGSGLNQAIAMTGGKQLLSGKVEFVRFKKDGEMDRRVFSYKQNSPLDTSRNPILEDGDIINVKDSLFGTSTDILNKILQPVTPILFIRELID